MIILRNLTTGERMPYTEVVGPHTYTGQGTETAHIQLADGREFSIRHGEIISVMEDGRMIEWEILSF